MESIEVLIIDDDVSTAEMHAQFLRQTPQFKPIGIASKLDTARSMIRVYKPKLIILDFDFSNGRGMDLLRDIVLDTNGIKPSIIFITYCCETSSITTAMNFGCFDYLLKPVSYERLSNTLYRYLKYSNMVSSYDKVSQMNIDRIFNVLCRYRECKTYKMLPKGINGITLDKIKSFFDEDSEASHTVETLSSRLGISKTTSRRYLEYCYENGYLKAKNNYHGSVGRPEIIYCKYNV